MPIKRLERQEFSFPRLGVLRKGSPKTGEGKSTKIGKDLDFFRFDSDDTAAMEAFESAYGKEPRDIDVFLPYATAEENFTYWQESWVAGGLQHRCDGETCVRHLTKDGTYSEEPIPCPGGCKEVGRLMVIIPQLQRMAYVTVLTHSINDILELDSNLQAIQAWNGTLQGVPLVLQRRERSVSTPGTNGKRVMRSKWLLSLEAKPEWVSLQLEKLSNAALEVKSAPLQIAGSVVDDNEYVDMVEEIDADDIWAVDGMPDDIAKDAMPTIQPISDKQKSELHAVGTELHAKEWNTKRPELVLDITKGRTDSSSKLTADEAASLIASMRSAIPRYNYVLRFEDGSEQTLENVTQSWAKKMAKERGAKSLAVVQGAFA